jgi:hypothetical protein
MRNIVVKGKTWAFGVGSKKTVLTGPFGRVTVPNANIAAGPITPGKVTNYIAREYYA